MAVGFKRTAPVHRLIAVGNALRMDVPSSGDVQLVLVAGEALASQWWLNVLAMARRPLIRHYITRADMESMVVAAHRADGGSTAGAVLVQPSFVPSFLVTVDGWIVDWFLAPLPSHAFCNPTRLVAAVESHARTLYDRRLRRTPTERVQGPTTAPTAHPMHVE